MADQRFKNVDWELPTTEKGGIRSWDAVKIAVLMDIRDELKQLNRLLHCPNFQAIPHKLDLIKRKIPARRKRRPT